MAAPFFSGKNDRRVKEKVAGQLSETETYHIFMQAYPAYSIGLIEEELSWRQIREFMDCWENRPPQSIRIDRIGKMMEKKLGFRWTPAKVSDETLLAQIKGMGWL